MTQFENYSRLLAIALMPFQVSIAVTKISLGGGTNP
jgi:hypothetical protein